jgi:hypothetical protein
MTEVIAAGSKFLTLSWKPDDKKFFRIDEKIVVNVD